MKYKKINEENKYLITRECFIRLPTHLFDPKRFVIYLLHCIDRFVWNLSVESSSFLWLCGTLSNCRLRFIFSSLFHFLFSAFQFSIWILFAIMVVRVNEYNPHNILFCFCLPFEVFNFLLQFTIFFFVLNGNVSVSWFAITLFK